MHKNWPFIILFLLLGSTSFSQGTPADSLIIPVKEKKPAIDTNINYDELLQDMDAFMDSKLMPHSYFLASVSLGKSYFNFSSKDNTLLQTAR
ncbi:MAG TPA: hypothetical protein VET23_09185, partial [Chitinophagaceae bacterium]|nr:hypothetical protein [Chitinophagaceae bacterium]